LRAFERKRYHALAEGYDDFFTPVTMNAVAPLLKAAGVKAGGALLDVACGSGAVAAAAQAQGAKAAGTDIAPGMVALAKACHPGIDFREADAEHLPFPDGAFDAVACNFGIGHFPWPERAVAEFVRALKPGGRLALAWWDMPEKQRILGLFREAVAEIGAKMPPDVPTGYSLFRFADPVAFRGLLEGAGLSDVSISEHPATHRVADAETLWRGGLSSFAVTTAAVLSQDLATQEKIRAAFERRTQTYKTADGLVLPVAFRVASGRK
jgi:ubiquinone/menaquinone biosynthesis C-methylase UbiE